MNVSECVVCSVVGRDPALEVMTRLANFVHDAVAVGVDADDVYEAAPNLVLGDFFSFQESRYFLCRGVGICQVLCGDQLNAVFDIVAAHVGAAAWRTDQRRCVCESLLSISKYLLSWIIKNSESDPERVRTRNTGADVAQR